uniref:S100 calcium binding protein A13 n=1 Tax=Aquila chrysaetos chrysaetos TaxID=223781 RepID=A0A663DZ35_AQUCH
MATGKLTELETAIEKIVTVFFTYAAKEGKKGTLTAGEFKELVQLQLPNLMKDVPSLEEKMSELDVNNDEELKFATQDPVGEDSPTTAATKDLQTP